MSTIVAQRIDTYLGHKDCIYALEQDLATGTFYSAGSDGFVVGWHRNNPNLGTLLAKVEQSVYALCKVPDSPNLLIGQNFRGLHLVDTAQKKEIKSVQFTDAAIFDIQLWQNTVITATGDGTVHLHKLDDFLPLARIKYSERSARCIAIHPHQAVMAVGYSDHAIRIFDLEQKKLLQTIEAHQGSVFALRYSPDGRYLLSGSRDAHLKIWNVAQSYALHQSIVAHMFAINHIAYHPKGHLIATCSMDKSIKIWDADTFKLLKVLDKARHAGHGTSVNKVLWLAIDEVLITCSDDRTIGIWSVQYPQHSK